MKFPRCLAASLIAVAALLAGCSQDPEARTLGAEGQAGHREAPPIERYRTALAAVTAAQQALALETARFNEENWSAVAKQSLSEANVLQGTIAGLMAFEEAASAAATLRSHVAGMQRQLQGIDAHNWHAILPDLLLLNESIRSDMDELTDLAASGPFDAPDHDHPPDPVDEV
jgi:hypothetical protein